MQKRTTNYSFQKYGDVFYNVKLDGSRKKEELTIEKESFSTFYYSTKHVQLNTKTGIILLVVSLDGIHYESFVIHRVVRLKPNVYFNMISISSSSVVEIVYALNTVNVKTMDIPFVYERMRSKLHIKEIYTSFYQVRKSRYTFAGERHDFFELTYVDQGTLTTMVDGKSYLLHKYDLMLYYPGQFHTQSTGLHDSCSYLTVTFDMDAEFKENLKNQVFRVNDDIYHVLCAFMKTLENPGYLSQELTLTCLQHILVLLLKYEKLNQEDPQQNVMQLHHENSLLNEVINYIHNHIDENLTVEDLCHKYSISRSSLQILFHENLNVSPKQYMNDIKMQQAKVLLRKKNKTISEISDALGFTSVQYFSRKFKEQYGKTPTEYVRSIES